MSRWLELARKPELILEREPSSHQQPSKSPDVQLIDGFEMVCDGLMVGEVNISPEIKA
ncbi:hypothetical protein [Halocynthiibacter namhaensis]|uniref:hypothetical protein n=1 Tax=Halocynthiibacter namhaensis TaxID=1290553 RepID=UPI0012E01E67|nr:hypothetical protein [Halocynthiibacter namhaensis]